jgi:cytochrome P450
MTGAFPPGPTPTLLQRVIYHPGRDPLAFFTNLARTYGDVVHYRLASERIFLVSDPTLIRDILVTHNQNFVKGRGLERTKLLFGEGLLTSEGAVHRQQRRLIQPMFHRERIAGYGRTMVAEAERMRAGWTDGATVDVDRDMMRLTLAIVGRTLFDTDVDADAIGVAMGDVVESFWLFMLPFAPMLDRLPLPGFLRSRRARETLDAFIYRLIADRRASGRDHGDLLSTLIAAQDAETRSPMSDTQVRDEAMTLFLAGHETTANALAWIWYALSTSPAAESRLHDELDRVLQGRPPTTADIGALTFVEKVVTEAMRLYPPAWIVGRRALGAYPIAGYVAPPGALLLMSPFIVHHDSRFYPEPERFHPDRWTPEFKASLPRFAYFPFGGGPRQCIGESFAWMELVLLVATVAQRWRLRLVPGHAVVPRPLVTLRMKHGLRMTAHARELVTAR